MQIEKILMPHEVIKGKEMPMNSIVLRLDNKAILVCSKFNHSRKQNLELLVWLPAQNKWVRTYAKNEYTEIMWDYYRKHKHAGGGSRIYNGSITDYECSKNPLHDFRRVYN